MQHGQKKLACGGQDSVLDSQVDVSKIPATKEQVPSTGPLDDDATMRAEPLLYKQSRGLTGIVASSTQTNESYLPLYRHLGKLRRTAALSRFC